MSKPARKVPRRRYWRRQVASAGTLMDQLPKALDYVRAMARSAADTRQANRKIQDAIEFLVQTAEDIKITDEEAAR